MTPNLITNVLHVPKVACPNYPSHPCLLSIFWYELASHFCERPMLWDDALNFTTHEFAKDLRILNMVMTFVLNTRSRYNIITAICSFSLFSLGGSFYRLSISHNSIYDRSLSRHCYT